MIDDSEPLVEYSMSAPNLFRQSKRRLSSVRLNAAVVGACVGRWGVAVSKLVSRRHRRGARLDKPRERSHVAVRQLLAARTQLRPGGRLVQRWLTMLGSE